MTSNRLGRHSPGETNMKHTSIQRKGMIYALTHDNAWKQKQGHSLEWYIEGLCMKTLKLVSF